MDIITPIAASARNYPGSGSTSHTPEPALSGRMATGEQAGPDGTPPKALNSEQALPSGANSRAVWCALGPASRRKWHASKASDLWHTGMPYIAMTSPHGVHIPALGTMPPGVPGIMRLLTYKTHPGFLMPVTDRLQALAVASTNLMLLEMLEICRSHPLHTRTSRFFNIASHSCTFFQCPLSPS